MEQFVEDVIILLDGFNKEFTNQNTRWSYMSKEEKKKWFVDFSCEHARPIVFGGEM